MNSYENKTREELIELVNYYKSEYVLVCNFYQNEKKDHRKTKKQLKMFRDRSRELAQKYYGMIDGDKLCQ